MHIPTICKSYTCKASYSVYNFYPPLFSTTVLIIILCFHILFPFLYYTLYILLSLTWKTFLISFEDANYTFASGTVKVKGQQECASFDNIHICATHETVALPTHLYVHFGEK